MRSLQVFFAEGTRTDSRDWLMTRRRTLVVVVVVVLVVMVMVMVKEGERHSR